MRILLCYEHLDSDLCNSMKACLKATSSGEVTDLQIVDVYSSFDLGLIKEQEKKVKQLINKVGAVIWEGTQGSELLPVVFGETMGKKPLFVLTRTEDSVELEKNYGKNDALYKIKYNIIDLVMALRFIVDELRLTESKNAVSAISNTSGRYLKTPALNV